MKNTTLLKVLSATAIFSAIAAIESYDQDNFAFAAEETPIVANNSTTTSTNSSNNEKPTATTATPAENSSASTTPEAEADRLEKEKAEKEKAEADRLEKEKLEEEKAEADRLEKEKLEKEKAEADRLEKEKLEKEKAEADRLEKEKLEKEKAEANRLEKEKLEKEKAEEPATVAQDVKALKDGEYKITAEAIQFGNGKTPSMAAAGLEKEKTKLIVKNGQYSVNVTFKPITLGGLTGYLGDLKYYDGDKTHNNRYDIEDNEFKPSTIVESYKENETDSYFDAYKKKFPNRTTYPKTFNFNVDKNKIDSNNKLETYTEVFVPVMDSTPGAGTQRMILKFDLSSLARKKVTADNYEAATYENPNKDVEYKGTIKKDFPIHVQGHFRNANNNDEESLYGSALDSYVKVEKVGDKYKYTLRFKKGLADVGGEFYPFELHKVAYQGKDVPLTTLATNGNSSVKEGSIITDKLLEKIQLDGTAPYPNGALMSHFVTLKLYYETATAYKERPVKLEDVVAPAKPKPVKPAPTTPKEEPKPATPTAADHNVDADKVPNTFPTTVKAELNGRTTGTASIYENAFVKDVKVEKVGDKYQYTIQVKEGKSSNMTIRNKPFTVSKLTYKGTEVSFTEVDAATKLKEGKILTDALLDKIQVDAVMSVQTKGGAKPRYEERVAESTIAVDFPKVEKPKEVVPAKPSVPDHEVDADKVPNTFPTTIKAELNGRTTNSSSIYENAFVKDVKVEKVGDKYQYTIQVKEGKSSTYLLRNKPFTVSKLTYKGNEINFTEVDAATKLKEGKILTDTLLDKIQVDATISVQTKVGGKIKLEERAAESTIALDFPTVEKVKEEVANNLVPAKINNAHVADKPSMADGALVHEKTRVEKVNDSYHYYLTFKDLRFGAQVGTVDTLTVDNTAAEKTDLGGEGHEKVFHFASPEKLTEKTITFSVLVDGKPLRGHSSVPATLKFNWDAATPLTADQVTSLHKDETTKAQAEKERLEKEAAAKAEREKAEADRLAKEKAEREKAEADRLAKEKAEREKAEAGRLAKEKAEREKAEADKLAKEKAEREKAEADKLAKEKAEREKAEADRLAKEKAEAARLEKERLEKEAAAKAEKERLEKEAATKAEKERLEKEVKAVEKTVTELKDNKAQLEKLVKEKEEAINNATTEVEKEKLTTEKAAVEKELTAKVTELNAENEKAVNLKFEAVKNQAVENIVKDKSLSNEEAKQLEAIVKTASLKDTLVARVVENDPSEDVTVTFDNTAIQADKLVVQKADKETVAKVEELVKNTDENLSVVKTIDLHFESNNKTINKQGETRAVTVAVVANKDEELEVYYVNGDKLEKVPSAYKDGKLTFFTSHFSKYTIVKKGKTVPSNQNTPVPVTPVPSDKNEEITSDKGEALVQEELPALNINELSKEQGVKEEAEATAQNIFGQLDNKENKNVEVEKTVSQNTSQTVATGLKQLAKTGLNATATAGLGVLALLSALVLRRKNNK